MDALRDSHWLLGNPIWWGLEDNLPPDLRNGELKPPNSWNYSSPRENDEGWKRQRLKPLAYALLGNQFHGLFFLNHSTCSFSVQCQTPNDLIICITFFYYFLVSSNLSFGKFSYESIISNYWIFFITYRLDFIINWIIYIPFHILIDSRIGWIYILFSGLQCLEP